MAINEFEIEIYKERYDSNDWHILKDFKYKDFDGVEYKALYAALKYFHNELKDKIK